MKTYFKMNTLLSISTVIILGYFIFEVLFGIMTGNFGMYGSEGSSSSHHGSTNSSASPLYSYDAIINALLLLLVKLLIVIFFLVLISGASSLIKELWNREENDNNSYLFSKDSSNLLVVTGAFIGIIILYSVFKSFFTNIEVHNSIGLSNNVFFYNTSAISIDNFFDIFLNILLYVTAVLLGIEIFSYFMRKQKR